MNKDKSNIFFLKKTKRKVKTKIKRIIGLKSSFFGNLYLRNSLIIGRSKVKEFGRLKNKVQLKLTSWKHKLLSNARRATLIKSVLHAISNNCMTTFKVPLVVYKELDIIACRFW